MRTLSAERRDSCNRAKQRIEPLVTVELVRSGVPFGDQAVAVPDAATLHAEIEARRTNLGCDVVGEAARTVAAPTTSRRRCGLGFELLLPPLLWLRKWRLAR